MKVILPGGSGQLGQILARHYARRDCDVVVLSRKPSGQVSTNERIRIVHWDAKTIGDWADEIDGADLVINLTGHSVDCRYNDRNRLAIMDSRVDSTRAVVNAIRQAANPPKLFLQSSTATIYSHRFDAANDDVNGIIGGKEPNLPDTWKFSIDVATAWEAAATQQELPGTRTVLLRSAMVMSPDAGGVFDVLLRLVRLGLGGTNGSGKQFVSWIHDADFISAIDWIADHEELSGPINLSSPGPLPNREFMAAIRKSWGQPIGLPATRWMLEIGAFFLRTETELILKSRRVVPTRLIESGFRFQFDSWLAACEDLCSRRRQ